MTDQVYFIGYRPEQFTGWDGTGDPSYTSVVSTDSNETNNLGWINLTTSGNVIWKDLDITDTSNPVYILLETNLASSNEASLGNLFITDGANVVSIGAYSLFTSYAINQFDQFCIVRSGTYESGGTVSLTSTLYTSSSITVLSSGVSSTISFFIKLSSTTSGFDTISIVYKLKGTTTEITLYTGSITPLSSLKAIFSCQNQISGYSNIVNYFYYCAVANFDLTGAYIDYTQVSAEATYTGWTGTVSTLTTYPLVTTAPANGLYAYNTGDQVTFTPAKSLTAGNGYTTPKCTFIDTTLMSSKDDLGFQAVPIVKSASTSTTYTMGSVATPTTTPTNYQWINYQNPSNLSNWTVPDVNTLEFGLKRTK